MRTDNFSQGGGMSIISPPPPSARHCLHQGLKDSKNYSQKNSYYPRAGFGVKENFYEFMVLILNGNAEHGEHA